MQDKAVMQDRLKAAQRVGRHELIAGLEERLADENRRLHDLERRAYATRLLRELMRRHHARAIAPVLPGLEQSVSRMLLAITGRDRTVGLSPAFAPATITEGTTQVEHDVSSLSGGTREQLELVIRIALGEAYAEQYGRTMMVLDDALLYTDPYRHERIKEVLKRAAGKLQILLLTSQPERYRGIVPHECQFELEAVAADSSAA
jgi:uncharacterized protein YhaN